MYPKRRSKTDLKGLLCSMTFMHHANMLRNMAQNVVN